MRYLDFKIKGQQLARDSTCDFSRIIWKTKNFLTARFLFSEDWKGTAKVAVFERLGNEYPAQISNSECVIPEEALTWRNFSLYVIGQTRDGTRMRTNSIKIQQEVT